MNGIDILTALLGIVAAGCVVSGGYILSRRDLEIAALAGAIPVAWGLAIGAAALVLYAIQHVSIGLR